jgi:hypothetical protein
MRCFLRKSLYKTFIKPCTENTILSDRIKYSHLFNPWYKDCVLAIDGTLIPISPPYKERAIWRDRKGNLSQNVLAVCNFDMEFTDVLSGSEGSTADSTLWVEGQRCGAIRIPNRRYVLGDAGFPNCDLCIAPYRGVRYHLQEWDQGNNRPQNKEELFNLRHARLRNVIERIFGVLKARFKIITRPRAFTIRAQVRVISALCAFHNILTTIGKEPSIKDGLENIDIVSLGHDVIPTPCRVSEF